MEIFRVGVRVGERRERNEMKQNGERLVSSAKVWDGRRRRRRLFCFVVK